VLGTVHAQTRQGSRAWLVLTVLCLVSSVQLILANRALLAGAFSQPPYDTSFQWMSRPPLPAPGTTPPDTSGPANLPMLWALVRDEPLFNCYEYIRLRTTASPDRPLVFAGGDSAVTMRRFAPNRVDFDVQAGAMPSRVYLNTNAAPGWHTDAGALEMPADGAPFVTLRPGQSGTFAFWFTPPGVWLGLGIFVVGLGVSASVWRLRIGDEKKARTPDEVRAEK
jgi:hypothetical protein